MNVHGGLQALRKLETFALFVLIGAVGSAAAEEPRTEPFRIEEAATAKAFDPASLKPGVVVFRDAEHDAANDISSVTIAFDDWARTQPVQKKFLALYPAYVEPQADKTSSTASAGTVGEHGERKLTMYVAQARFLIGRPPSAVDPARYVNLKFIERIDPAIKHSVIAAADVNPLTDAQGQGNANPDRKWCDGRDGLICIHSIYALEGKIPLGIMLVNKLRDSAKKISDHIDFDSELSFVPASALDQDGVKTLTGIDAAISGALEQNIFYVNQIMKFGKLLAVFQADPSDQARTVVTAYMALAVDTGVLDRKKEYENVPVLRNLVPAQVLMGQSSFNSGSSISAGLPIYARNEIRTIAGILDSDK
jgi:hypothetical protein